MADDAAYDPDDSSPPPLIMPDAEGDAVREAYAGAGVILEYGAGGSTAIAAAMPGKLVFSVESDANWIRRLQSWLAADPPRADIRLHHGDIGPTRDWGYPVDRTNRKGWGAYPASVWKRDDFRHPDVVLIDGRFRAGCFLTVLQRITRPVTLLFDDYKRRTSYHEVETLVKPVGMIGRMARFDLVPMQVPPDRADWARKISLRPL